MRPRLKIIGNKLASAEGKAWIRKRRTITNDALKRNSPNTRQRGMSAGIRIKRVITRIKAACANLLNPVVREQSCH